MLQTSVINRSSYGNSPLTSSTLGRTEPRTADAVSFILHFDSELQQPRPISIATCHSFLRLSRLPLTRRSQERRDPEHIFLPSDMHKLIYALQSAISGYDLHNCFWTSYC